MEKKASGRNRKGQFASPERKTPEREFREAHASVKTSLGVKDPPKAKPFEPKAVLTLEDLSEITDISIYYLRALEKTNRFDRLAVAAERLIPSGGQTSDFAARVRKNGAGIPIEAIKKKRISAHEVFSRWWEQPIGRARILNSATIRETMNDLFNITPLGLVDNINRFYSSRNVLRSAIEAGAEDIFETVKMHLE